MICDTVGDNNRLGMNTQYVHYVHIGGGGEANN